MDVSVTGWLPPSRRVNPSEERTVSLRSLRSAASESQAANDDSSRFSKSSRMSSARAREMVAVKSTVKLRGRLERKFSNVYHERKRCSGEFSVTRSDSSLGRAPQRPHQGTSH